MKFHNRIHANQYLKCVICIISDDCSATVPCTKANEDCNLQNGICLCAKGFQRAASDDDSCVPAPLGLGKS